MTVRITLATDADEGINGELLSGFVGEVGMGGLNR